MKTEKAIDFLYSIKGKTVYLVEIINDKVDGGLYNPVTLDRDYIELIYEDMIEGRVELKTWQHRLMRDFEHYVLYFKVNE